MSKSWQLELLGGASLRGEGVSIETLERKAAGLLAYLTLEGPTPRSRVAGLLWPEASEKQARANLRKRLWKLRMYEGLVISGAQLRLGPNVRVDVVEPSNLAALRAADGGTTTLLSNRRAAPMLAGLDYDDCPDFHEWLLLERERMLESYHSALVAEADHYESSSDYAGALQIGQRLLELDPLSEVNYRRLMRLHSLVDDRAAALEVYERCRALLARELGVEPLRETSELASAIEAGVPAAYKTKLPMPDTPFVGREEELEQLERLLAGPDCRLLSLVGPGGIGKTRLAIQVARAQTGAYPDGVYFVALASIDTEAQMISAVASALGFYFHSPRDHRAQLLAYLREKQLLLVLDNVEHLQESAGLLAELLVSARSIRMLVTSRDRIHLKEAWTYVVPGLHVPANIEDLPTSSSAQLFSAVARRVAPQLELEHARDAVISICQLVEGMPLALELAAAWLWALSPQEVLQGLSESFEFPVASVQDVPERHRSLYATFEYSWGLLPESERAAMRSLSVCRGGFALDAARDVADAPLSVLLALVSRSLLSRTLEGRFEMHELLRQFAHGKLEADRAAALRASDRHAEHFAAVLGDAGVWLKGGTQQLAAIQAIESDIPNVRAGWRWACSRGHAATIEMALEGLWFFEIRCQYEEGMELVSDATKCVSPESIARGKLLALQGVFAHRLADFALCERVSRASLQTLQRLEAALDTRIYVNLGIVHMVRGDMTTARITFEAGRLDAEARGDHWGLMMAFGSLGILSMVEGDHAAAVTHLEESYRRACEIEDRWGKAICGGNLGNLLARLDRLDEAATLLHETLDDARVIGLVGVVAENSKLLGDVYSKRKHYDEAERMYLESLRCWRMMSEAAQVGAEASSMSHAALALHGLGTIEVERGEPQKALAHFIDAWEHAVRIEAHRSALRSLICIAELLARSRVPEPALELAAFVLEHDMVDEATHSQAQGLIDSVESQLEPFSVAAKMKQSRTLSVDAVAQRLAMQRQRLRREPAS